MKYILLLASVTLSSHTLGIEKPRTPCQQAEQQQQQQEPTHRDIQKPVNPAKWVPREAPW